MAAWPASLPQYFQIGMTDTRQSGFLRSATDTGPYKQRKRFTAVARFIGGSMIITAAQRTTFETFYVTTTNQGADAFDFLDPHGFATVSVRFVEPPAFTALGNSKWQMDLKLEVLP